MRLSSLEVLDDFVESGDCSSRGRVVKPGYQEFDADADGHAVANVIVRNWVVFTRRGEGGGSSTEWGKGDGGHGRRL